MRLDDDALSATMKAYSEDLREKIIAAVRRRMSKAQAAHTFGVGTTSVKRYVKLAEEGRPLTPGKAPGKKGKLDGNAMKLLEEDLHVRPAASYEKRADLLRELLGVTVSKATFCRAVKIKGLLRKAQARTREALIEALGVAISSVSTRDARGFFDHSGYHLPVQLL
jgi:transposase